MTNMKSTKRALLLSVVALLLCFTMLMGTTYAWFTDSVTSTGNKIVAGNLDIDLYMWTATDASTEITNESAPIFGAGALAQNNAAETLWEPGKTQTVYLSIKNNGTLALKYQVALDVKNVEKDLIDVMQYAITPDATYGTAPQWTNGVPVVAGINATQAVDVVLEKGAEHFFALSVHMDEEAGNEYQEGSISFDIKVLATQLNAEADSFGPDYDKDATYPVVSSAVTVPATATEAATVKTTAKNDNGDTVTVAEVNMPAAILNNLPDEVKTVQLAHSEPKVDTVNNTVSFDSIEIVDQDGNIVDLEALNNAENLTVKLYVGDAFASGADITVYHDGEKMADTTVDVEGYITYTATHFCQVDVSKKVALGSEIKELLNDSTTETVVLGQDIDLNDTMFQENTNMNLTVKNGKTLDLNNYSVIRPAKGSGSGIVIPGKATVTVKNGSVIGEGDMIAVDIAVGANVTFDNVDFIGFGSSFVRLRANNTAETTIVFKNCNFTNAPVELKGMNGACEVTVQFIDCTFSGNFKMYDEEGNLLTDPHGNIHYTSELLSTDNYICGDVSFDNCTFDYDASESKYAKPTLEITGPTDNRNSTLTVTLKDVEISGKNIVPISLDSRYAHNVTIVEEGSNTYKNNDISVTYNGTAK